MAFKKLILFLAFVLTVSVSSPGSGDPELSRTQEKIQVFEDYLLLLYNDMCLADQELDFKAFRYAVIGYYNLRFTDKLSQSDLLTIIDFNKSANEQRFYVLSLSEREVLHRSYVAHGENSGGEFATEFSNRVGSHQSSLGFYVTGETYFGRNGYSLTLDGVEKGINDKLRERHVVIHKADYASKDYIDKYGTLGHSEGCAAIPESIYLEVIDLVKEGSCVFAYYQSPDYLMNSSIINYPFAVQSFFEQAGYLH